MIVEFIWDEKKDVVNKMKHGISFNTAKKVFSDPNKYEMFDLAHSITEPRWKVIGLAGWVVLTVIFMEKDGLTRIISARKATKTEEERYFYGYSTQYIRY